MFSHKIAAFSIFTSLIIWPASAIPANRNKSCRYLPDDLQWPSVQGWNELNGTVGGRLIKTIPLGSPCHDPTYDGNACAYLQDSWDVPQIHVTNPSSIMSPIFQNQSCDPFTREDSSCSLGNYVDYSINVSSAADVSAGLAFAQKGNIRLVIKNTGHDLLGKSTGKGSLGLWMHNLKSMSFFNYSSVAYQGSAAKLSAGVQAYEAYAAANSHGVTIVGGDCPTVGLVGGYYAGGGHGPFTSAYGMAADQVLEWEVVVANGTHLTATPTQNSDLYWALSGGGAGTYGVVLSVTVKTRLDGIFGGGSLNFSSTGISADVYWELIEAWHSSVLGQIVDAGGQMIYEITSAGVVIRPLYIPGATIAKVTSLLQPLLTKLNQNGVAYNLNVTSVATFFDHHAIYDAPLPYGDYTINDVVGSRLIPRSIVNDPFSRAALMTAFRNITSSGEFLIGGIGVNANHTVSGNTPSSNAVLPAWRTAPFFNISGADAIAMDPQQRQLLEVVYEGLENAGITLESLDGAPFACFVGSYAVGKLVSLVTCKLCLTRDYYTRLRRHA
ncbi:hypothetical protein EAE96_007364 [Botrytis aclada]|nr:hypothetical protein EAE96_007364 [Botrytis aclada]